ncbi:hypothetical protein CROQUDRAFT_60970 [Cronartium quercuum f. sp. fusiforme G11]|uniref:Coronin-7 n=1 Tax=Cronartium quercuum f. sp. fusiforme G11 TaxID=708437 RepID=A0A9P6NLF4_9BASI|nr:hypothetical protein CROQUDRAFT_60970 [Cronartium quercuum f. sp. fusiforme G11]
MPYHQPGKCANKVPGFVACPGGVSDLSTSPFDDLMAAGSEKGEISVFKLPATLNPLDYNPHFELCGHFAQGSLSSGKPVDKLAFHPTTHALMAACSGSELGIWDLLGGSSAKPSIHISAESQLWDLQWDWEGALLAGTTKTGMVSVWDPRAADSKVGECVAHGVGGRKCSRLGWVGSHILTTGVNKLHEREFSLYDPRALSKGAFKTQQIDNSTGVLIPSFDPNRSVVYLASRGESSIRWFDIGSTSAKIEVNHTRLVQQIVGLTMAPINNSTVNVMQAELCKLLILSRNNEVLPVVIQAPKRQYLDFHPDVMPSVRSMTPAQSSVDWINGGNQPIDIVSQDPACSRVPSVNPKVVGVPLAVSEPKFQPTRSDSVAHSTPTSSKQDHNSTKPAIDEIPTDSVTTFLKSAQVQQTKPDPLPAPISSSNISTLPRDIKPSAVTPRWSRKYLSGKTPMKTDYEDLQNLSATFTPDRELIRCTPKFFYIPLGGAGGKLAGVEVEKKGRLATHLPALLNGTTVIGFEVDLLVEGRVFVSGDDSKVRVFQVPEEGLTSDTEACSMVLSEANMDRICVIKSHPIAKDIFLTISDDQGSPTARLWNLGNLSSPIKPSLSIPLPHGAISSANWSLDGSLIAITTKTRKVYVLDPRATDNSPEKWCMGPSHESSKPVQVTWVDDRTHLLTAGFSNTAMREVKLHKIDQYQRSINAITRIGFDISPSPFFIHFDPDISVAFCWSKGERTMHLVEIVLEDEKPVKLEALSPSSYSTIQTGYAFFPKQIIDVCKVEVNRALRLTPNSVEVVSFSVPRSKPEFFQDDIYPPTRQLLLPTYEIGEDWLLEGDRKIGTKRVDLKPQGMIKLSEAPITTVKTNQSSLVSFDMFNVMSSVFKIQFGHFHLTLYGYINFVILVGCPISDSEWTKTHRFTETRTILGEFVQVSQTGRKKYRESSY